MPDQENAVALVERGYNESTRCLNFRVNFYNDPAHTLRAVRLIGGYGAFDGEAVAQALEPFLTRDVAYGVAVGRENSPVIYLTVGCRREFYHVIENALRDVRADELDWTDGTLRAWWD
jgi:hypothetical protein